VDPLAPKTILEKTIVNQQKKIYQKAQSFDTFFSNLNNPADLTTKRVVRILEEYLATDTADSRKPVLSEALESLKTIEAENANFRITIPIADELSHIKDADVPRYIFHRYRYDVFPRQKRLDEYPPYLQIEPTSICNYRCVFCYQTDNTFTQKSGGFMGSMSFELFKKIIDGVEGKVEFFSLASRGEPFVCKDIDKMLKYCEGKFLGLKVNTNASLLNTEHCHAILSGGVNTLVISADAAQEPLYSQLRVNGKLDKVLANLQLFKTIQEKFYPKSRLITRVSGVKYNAAQEMNSMTDVWGRLVDQVCFVDYNPWENVYESAPNHVAAPCSDLWRRMFVWYDGTVNPCDTDYKSLLTMGKINQSSVSKLWRGAAYEQLRKKHLENERKSIEPCRRCTVI